MNAVFLQHPLDVEQLLESIEDSELRLKLDVLHKYSIDNWGFNNIKHIWHQINKGLYIVKIFISRNFKISET